MLYVNYSYVMWILCNKYICTADHIIKPLYGLKLYVKYCVVWENFTVGIFHVKNFMLKCFHPWILNMFIFLFILR